MDIDMHDFSMNFYYKHHDDDLFAYVICCMRMNQTWKKIQIIHYKIRWSFSYRILSSFFNNIRWIKNWKCVCICDLLGKPYTDRIRILQKKYHLEFGLYLNVSLQIMFYWFHIKFYKCENGTI